MTELSKHMMGVGKSGKRPNAHYQYFYRGIKLDPYRIEAIYGLSGPQATIVRKGLRAGAGKKTLREDIRDIQCACERWLEMLDEDERLEDDHK